MTVAWGSNTSKRKGTNRNMQYLDSNQEEADTKLLLHVVDATVSGVTRIDIVSPDNDVFVLVDLHLRTYTCLYSVMQMSYVKNSNLIGCIKAMW